MRRSDWIALGTVTAVAAVIPLAGSEFAVSMVLT
jgi:hypothetical protein